MNLDLIIRTSQRKADAQSPREQRQGAHECAEERGYTIVATHDSGGSESGKTMERAGLALAQQRIRDGLTDGIIVAYLDRLGRAPIEESMTFVRALFTTGGTLVAADFMGGHPIDLSAPSTETMVVNQMQANREQWLKSKKRYELGQRNAIKRGVHVGPTPFGYQRPPKQPAPDDPGVEEAQPLIRHPVNGPIVTQAYRIGRLQGITAAVHYLQANASLTASACRRLFANRVYLGEVHHETAGSNPKAHPPLTKVADFEACQVKPRHKAAAGDYPLSAIAQCGCGCDQPLTGQLQTVRGRSYRRYRVESREHGHGHASVSADALERHVREQLKAGFAASMLRLRGEDVDLAGAESELADARHELEALSLDLRARKTMGAELWHRALDAHRENVKVQQERYRVELEKTRTAQTFPAADQLDDDDAMRTALLAIGRRIVVAPGRGDIASRVRVDRDDPAELAA
jgi:DNA invertase Pin-like site-specific DNA recombinase